MGRRAETDHPRQEAVKEELIETAPEENQTKQKDAPARTNVFHSDACVFPPADKRTLNI